jgi:hypothetical protein
MDNPKGMLEGTLALPSSTISWMSFSTAAHTRPMKEVAHP